MKPTQLFGFLILLSLFFSSCQKEIASIVSPTDSSSSTNPFLVKTYTEDIYTSATDHVTDSFKLSYDSKGRLTSMIEADSIYGLQFIYHYDDEQNLFTLDQYDNNKLSLHEIGYLNSSSYLDSTFQDDMEGDTTTEKYVYNTNNKVVQLRAYDYTKDDGSEIYETVTYEYDSDGNMTKQTDSEDDAITSYTYTSRTANTLNMGMNYLPQNIFLPDSFGYKSNSETDNGTHDYVFDSQKRLIKDVTTFTSGYVVIKNYGY